MPEGMQDPGAPSRRGRRRPELLNDVEANDQDEDVMAMDDSQLTDAGEQAPEELPTLYPGDIMLAKASITIDVAGQEAWFTYGIQSRLQPHEDEEMGFMRIAATVTNRVLDLAAAAEEEVQQEIERQRRARQSRPIGRPINNG